MNIDEIRKRHEKVERDTFVGFPEAYGEDAHQDRGWLLGHIRILEAMLNTDTQQRIAELEANQRDATNNELHVRVTELLKQNRKLEQRIAELEGLLREIINEAAGKGSFETTDFQTFSTARW